MPKERIYGGLLGDATRDVVVGWHGANSAHTRSGDGCGGTVTIGLTLDTEDQPETFARLDRVAINRLIRTLRRARDAAFGADA